MHINLVAELKAPTSLKQEHFRELRGHETVHEFKFSFSPNNPWLTCLETVDADGYYFTVLS